MPELPEVEVLVRHLDPRMRGQRIQRARVLREKSLRPTRAGEFLRVLRGAAVLEISRRAKYLVFTCQDSATRETFPLLGHLGMTGRMYLQGKKKPMPRHAVVVLELEDQDFIFEDMRRFGRLSLDSSALDTLAPEPFSREFSHRYFLRVCSQSSRAIKNLLLDQKSVVGLGNIYANEALYHAGIAPTVSAHQLDGAQVRQLRKSLIHTLRFAIQWGSSLRLDWNGVETTDRLFYYGLHPDSELPVHERFEVYGREGQPCTRCGETIQRIAHSGRSSFFCPKCQPAR